MIAPAKSPRLGGAVYIIPNLITTGNLFFGFFSIVKCLQGDFQWAASAILLAAVFDVLDGRVARLTGGSSEFGVQYDSLCDLVSFGLAPAFLMYQFGLRDLGRIGWVICFLFLACGALRLARFNVQSSIGKASGDFTGLPIPMAAAVVACFVAFTVEVSRRNNPELDFLRWWVEVFPSPTFKIRFMAVMGPALAFSMVSNIAYRSHKAFKLRGISPFKFLVGAVVVASLVAFQPELLGFAIAMLYALSGPFEWLIGWKKPLEDDEIFRPLRDDESAAEPHGFGSQYSWGDSNSGARSAAQQLEDKEKV